jgi:hypothetical protein
MDNIEIAVERCGKASAIVKTSTKWYPRFIAGAILAPCKLRTGQKKE